MHRQIGTAESEPTCVRQHEGSPTADERERTPRRRGDAIPPPDPRAAHDSSTITTRGPVYITPGPGASTPRIGVFDAAAETEIRWMTKGSIHYLENLNPDDWSMTEMVTLVMDWGYRRLKREFSVSLEHWKGSTRRTIKIKPQDNMDKDVCNIYVSQNRDGTPRWIMANCSEYKEWTQEMEALRTHICGKVDEEFRTDNPWSSLS